MAHFIGLVVVVVVVVMARKLVRERVQDRKSLCGLGSKCHIDLLTCVNYCLVWLSASSCSPPAVSAAARGQMINVSKFLEIARFEMVFEFISFHDGLTKGSEKGKGRRGKARLRQRVPQKVLAVIA